jgi:hypothetical protein
MRTVRDSNGVDRGSGTALEGRVESASGVAGTGPHPASRWLPRHGEEGATILALLPWLGVPVMVSAALARAGRPIPGEVLPVVAFLPVVALVYVLAVRSPARNVVLVGSSGLVFMLGLLGFLGKDARAGAILTFSVATLATAACALLAYAVVRESSSAPAWLATSGGAMVFSQGLDGVLTYLSVDNPFGWLAEASTERMLVSRVVLEAAAPAYPVLKIAIAGVATWALARQPLRPTHVVPLVLLVCYTGFSPAMFSAAHLFAP